MTYIIICRNVKEGISIKFAHVKLDLDISLTSLTYAKRKTEELGLLSVGQLGKIQFFLYSFPIIVLFFFFLSLIESNTIISLNNVMIILLSSLFNFIFIIVMQYLFLETNFKNEWR